MNFSINLWLKSFCPTQEPGGDSIAREKIFISWLSTRRLKMSLRMVPSVSDNSLLVLKCISRIE